MNNVAKKIWNIFTTVLVVVVVLCAILLMGFRLIGYQVYTVISGSMEPTYSVGDLLYVKEIDAKDIKVGDPITFIVNEELDIATHRVIDIKSVENEDGITYLHFYTKGDANVTADASPVHEMNVKGVPQFSIPYLGKVADFVQHPPGTYIALAVGVVLILLVFLPDMLGKGDKKTAEQAAVQAEPSAVEPDTAPEAVVAEPSTTEGE